MMEEDPVDRDTLVADLTERWADGGRGVDPEVLIAETVDGVLDALTRRGLVVPLDDDAEEADPADPADDAGGDDSDGQDTPAPLRTLVDLPDDVIPLHVIETVSALDEDGDRATWIRTAGQMGNGDMIALLESTKLMLLGLWPGQR